MLLESGAVPEGSRVSVGADLHELASPNFGERRDGARPSLVVLHYTAMESAEAACARLCDPVAEVSAHYVIGETGVLWQLVPEEARAWHAGAGEWAGLPDVNSRSIGIELANLGNHPFSEPQMLRLEGLLAGIFERWSLSPQDVIGHSDMAPGRKIDPGPRFDWRRLAWRGFSVWSDEEGSGEADPERFMLDLRRFGYPEMPPELALATFRMRFRPWAKGPLDATDCARAADLAHRWPVDRPALEA